ncbi:MAG: tyrosine-type recombinase/integrase [Nanoarchaeota archaeon]
MAKKDEGYSDSYISLRKNLRSKEVRAILETISDKRDHLLVNVLYELGCTVSELVNIKVEDITPDSILIGWQRRKVEISSGLRDEIKNFLKNDSSSEFLFFTRQSGRLGVRRTQQIVKNCLESKPSELRHVRIVELIKRKGINDIKRSCGLQRLQVKYFLKKEEIRQLQNHIHDKKHSLMFNLLLETGYLISELVDLRVGDIKEESIRIGSPKREISIAKKLASEIKESTREKNDEEFLFSTRQSDRISDKRVFQILKEYGKVSGVKLNPRILRNTKIACSLQAGDVKSKIERELGIKRLEFGSYGLLNKDD